MHQLLAHFRQHCVGYLALFVALAGTAYAAIPDSAGVIVGCYDTTAPLNGAYPLYVIDPDSNASCPQGRAAAMTPLKWNQQGPQGSSGPQGAAGPQGPAGPAADQGRLPSPGAQPTVSASLKPVTKGTAGAEVAIAKHTAFSGSSQKSLTVQCPASHPAALDAYTEPVFPPPNPNAPDLGVAGDLGGLASWATFMGGFQVIHSLRVGGKPQGWTALAVETVTTFDWALQITVDCATPGRASGLHVLVK